MNFPLSNVTWRPSYRVIPSRFPPIDLFEGVNSHTDDWDLLNELEGETSARLREEAGAIHLVRDGDRRYGPGWSPVMAAFCHFSASGSRFSDGTFGAYYCALTEATAIAETLYHAERFMGESNEPEAPTDIGNSAMESATLLRQGLTPEQVAEQRGLAANTVYRHLSDAIQGGELALEEVVNLDPATLAQIHAAFEQFPGQGLKVVFEALEGRVDYPILHCVRASMAARR